MKTGKFIAGRIRFGNTLCSVAVALSFCVMILAVAVSSGFRKEIRSGVAEVAGDVSVENFCSDEFPAIKGVEKVAAVCYHAGIVREGDNIQGVMFKGVEELDSISLGVIVPSRLAVMFGLEEGDPLLTYFVDEKVKVRKFTIAGIYDSPVQTEGNFIVYAGLEDICRVAGDDDCTLEITLAPEFRTRKSLKSMTAYIGASIYPAIATSSVDRYPQLFDWLDLIDFNVLAIILLMTVVAGFNMISGLLILLFRSIPTIGVLKSMGMNDRDISGVFVRVAARIVFKGMLVGNAVALLFCLFQGKLHFLKLNPENYFVSFVPVSLNIPSVLVADVVAYAAILALMLLPALFISKVDPARTVRAA